MDRSVQLNSPTAISQNPEKTASHTGREEGGNGSQETGMRKKIKIARTINILIYIYMYIILYANRCQSMFCGKKFTVLAFKSSANLASFSTVMGLGKFRISS